MPRASWIQVHLVLEMSLVLIRRYAPRASIAGMSLCRKLVILPGKSVSNSEQSALTSSIAFSSVHQTHRSESGTITYVEWVAVVLGSRATNTAMMNDTAAMVFVMST